MTRTLATVTAALAVTTALLATPAIAQADPGRSSGARLTAVGLTGGGTRLIQFDTERPGQARDTGKVRGLGADQFLIGIDYRVQDGKLYGVGNAGGLYTINPRTATATSAGALTVALEGTSFGVDVNPAANALRIISDTGQNLRHPFAGPMAGQTQVDARLNATAAPASGVTAAAYTNNDLNADTATTLFDIDTSGDQVVVQSPANSGTLVPTGKLGVDAGSAAGFDIRSTLRGGRTIANTGFATLTVQGRSSLYQVDLLTGAASRKGTFGTSVTDLALALNGR